MTDYTNLLSLNLKKLGYTVLIYNHIFTFDCVITECKVSKSVGKEAFTGLGQASTLVLSTEMASKLVYNQINVPKKKTSLPTLRFENVNSTDSVEILDLCEKYGEVIASVCIADTMHVKIRNIEDARLVVANAGRFTVRLADRHKRCVLIFDNVDTQCDVDKVLELCNLYGNAIDWEINDKKGKMYVGMKDAEEAEYLVGNHNGYPFDIKFRDEQYKARNATLIFEGVTSDKIAKDIGLMCEGYGKFVSTRLCRHMKDGMYVIMKDLKVAQRIIDDHNDKGFTVYFENQAKPCGLVFEKIRGDKSGIIIDLCNKYGGMVDHEITNDAVYVTMKNTKQANLLTSYGYDHFTVRYKDHLDYSLLPLREKDEEHYDDTFSKEKVTKEQLDQELADYMKESV